MRLVLDTSVIVAGLRSLTGASSLLLGMALRRKFDLLVSVPLLLEYEAVMKRPEQMIASGFSHNQIDEFLGAIQDRSVPVHLGYYWPISARDEDDSHVLTLAVAGHADGLVTHNIRDFAVEAAAAGINLYTPAEALTRLRS